MRKLLPVLLALIGLAAGAGAGLALRPVPEEPAESPVGGPATGTEGGAAATGHKADAAAPHGGGGEGATAREYVKLNNQFIVPVVENGEMASLVILSLSLEVTPGLGEAVYAREPKLRDAFLQVLFSHANTGGFRGAFTDGATMAGLRTALRETAQKIIGPGVTDALIIDLVRQDS